jgi:Leucine-rich repeat (LRR) protein
MKSATPKLVSKEEINQRFDLSRYEPINNLDNNRIIFFDGDTTITANLDSDWVIEVLEELKEDTSLDDVLIMINGNLTVDGNINIADYHPLLLVLGNVQCDVLKSGDDTIHITGDAHIKYVFYGYYNDGMINIDGTTYVPYVLNSDHCSSIKPSGAVLINLYSDHNDFFEYDYTREVLEEIVVPDALDKNGDVDVWKFIDIVKAGQSPFKEGVKPTRLVYEEELERIVSGNIEEVLELDWSDKKLKVFPAAIAKLKYLKKLSLSKNNISEIPAAIGALENLEELYMDKCGIIHISEAIGQLKKLRVWNLSGNFQMEKLPDKIGELSNLQYLKVDYIPVVFPEGLSQLEKLEEISMYSCYKDANNPGVFPEVLTKLKSLKRLDLRDNLLIEMPESILNIQTLEEFSWTGGRVVHPIYPDFRRFKQLKKLVISRKFNSWKERIFEMPSLEHLAIDRNEEKKQYFTQGDIDMWEILGPEQGEKFQNDVKRLLENKQVEADGRFSYLITPGMKSEELHDIHKLENLKYLDLSFNNLTDLPDTIFQLKKLEYLDLQYNKFSDEVKEKIIKAFPNTNVVLMSEMERRARGLSK